MVWGASIGSSYVSLFSVLIIIVSSICSILFSVTGFLSYWIMLSVTQNFFVGVWHGNSQEAIPLVVTESKSIALIFGIIYFIPMILDYLHEHRRIFISLAIYVFFVIIHIRSGDSATLAYLRNFLAPAGLAILAAAMTRRMDIKSRTEFGSYLGLCVIALLLLGTVAELFTGTEAWRTFVSAQSSGALNSLSENTSFLGINLPRTGGILVEPTNAGYVVAMAVLIIALFTPQQRLSAGLSRIGWVSIVGGVTVMSFAAAKSGALVLVIAIICAVLFKSKLSNAASFILGWSISFAMTAGYTAYSKGVGALMKAFANPISIVGGDSTTFHLAGFLYGIRNLVGHGIGVGGNFNRDRTQSWSEWLGTGSESSWGVLAYQTGLLGLLLWLVALGVLGSTWGPASAVVLCSWSAGAMFAEAMIGPQVAGLAMIGAALLRRQESRDIPSNGASASHASFYGGTGGRLSACI